MDRISDALKEAYASAPTDEIVYDTIEINHRSFDEPIYVVNSDEGIYAWIEASDPTNPNTEVFFTPTGFALKGPELTPDSTPQLRIDLDNVSSLIVQMVESTMNDAYPISIVWRVYLESDKSVPQINPPIRMQAIDIEADVLKVNIKAVFTDIYNVKFPNEVYTVERFPGLR